MSFMTNADGGWIRLGAFGPGISWTRTAPVFSERYGYRRPILRWGDWRLFLLRPWKFR